MSEFDKLKDEAEKEIREHPQQVKEGEQAIEKKIGVVSQDDEAARQDRDGQNDQGGGAGRSQGG